MHLYDRLSVFLVWTQRARLDQARRAHLSWLVPILSTLVLQRVGVAISARYGITFTDKGLLIDLFFALLFTYLVFLLSRSLWVFLAVQVVWFGLFYVGNAVKASVFGAPILPSDFGPLLALLQISDAWQVLWIVSPFAVVALLTMVNLPRSSLRLRMGVGGVALLVASVTLFPGSTTNALDSLSENVVWNQLINYCHHGPFLYLWKETARYISSSANPPSSDDVEAAMAALQTEELGPRTTAQPEMPHRRNVYMVVVESYWDARRLVQTPSQPDPLAGFRELWEAAGSSGVMSPTFAGATANAEFEALCGVPKLGGGVFFTQKLRTDLTCLPRWFRSIGYRSIAYHPNYATFWNRQQTYPKLGFDLYYDRRDFDLSDRDGPHLANGAFLSQVLKDIEVHLDDSEPSFRYVLTLSGHYPYELGEPRRHVFNDTERDDLVIDYVNSVYYSSRALMEFVSRIRVADPDGMIVVFGDHLPNLGPNLAGYVRAGLLPSEGATTADSLLLLATTPLVVIDGRRGPADVGVVAMYELPGIMANLLKAEAPTIWTLTQSLGDESVEFVNGRGLVVSPDGTGRVCNGEVADEVCEMVARFRDASAVITRDVCFGDAHACAQEPFFCIKEDGIHLNVDKPALGSAFGQVMTRFLRGDIVANVLTDKGLDVRPLHDLQIEWLGSGLELEATGNDPHFEVRGLRPVSGAPHALRVELTSESDTWAQLYFTSPEDLRYDEEKSHRLRVRKGLNHLVFALCSGELGPKLRLDPGSQPGSYAISAIELRAVERDTCVFGSSARAD